MAARTNARSRRTAIASAAGPVASYPASAAVSVAAAARYSPRRSASSPRLRSANASPTRLPKSR